MSFVFFKSDGWFLCNKDWPTEVELITCVGYDSIAAYVMDQQCYKVIRKSHTVVAGYITPPKTMKAIWFEKQYQV